MAYIIEVYSNITESWDRHGEEQSYYETFTKYLQMIAEASCVKERCEFRIVDATGIVYDTHNSRPTPVEAMANWRTRDLMALVALVEKPDNAFVTAARDILGQRNRPIPASYNDWYENPVFMEFKEVKP